MRAATIRCKANVLLLFVTAAIRCDELVAPNNGRIEYSSGSSGNQSFGVTATYVCEDGFRLTLGGSVRTCEGDGSSNAGNWTGNVLSCPEISVL